jgi:hypothetical protein
VEHFCKKVGITKAKLAEAAGVPVGDLPDMLLDTLIASSGMED